VKINSNNRTNETGSDSNILNVRIYGADYAVRGQTDVNKIKAVAEYLDSKMREVDKNVRVDSSLKIAILASLNITYELFSEKETINQLRQEIDALRKQLEDKVEELNRLIDRQL